MSNYDYCYDAESSRVRVLLKLISFVLLTAHTDFSSKTFGDTYYTLRNKRDELVPPFTAVSIPALPQLDFGGHTVYNWEQYASCPAGLEVSQEDCLSAGNRVLADIYGLGPASTLETWDWSHTP